MRNKGEIMSYTPNPNNQMSLDMEARIERDFTYHAPKTGQTERYEQIRAKAKELALLIVASTPMSREQSLALTNIEQAVMWANASIARHE